jgi:hypothetical protein
MEQQQPRADWEKAKEFRKGDLAVNVVRLPLRYPRYAIEVGSSYVDTRDNQTKMGRRIAIQTDGRGDALVLKSKLEDLTSLVREAEAWILEQAKATESQNRPAPRKVQAPSKDGRLRPNGAPLVGLKELKKRDKLAYEARKKAEEAAKPAESHRKSSVSVYSG